MVSTHKLGGIGMIPDLVTTLFWWGIAVAVVWGLFVEHKESKVLKSGNI